MRSRRDDVDPWAAVERALERGLCGMGEATDERATRRRVRFAAVVATYARGGRSLQRIRAL